VFNPLALSGYVGRQGLRKCPKPVAAHRFGLSFASVGRFWTKEYTMRAGSASSLVREPFMKLKLVAFAPLQSRRLFTRNSEP
jgi:hypothetical protein